MVLKEAIIQEGQKKEIVQKKVDEMETQINEVFQAISNDTVSEEAYSEDNITKIAQTLQQYKEKIKELEERSTYDSPSSLSAKRERRDNNCKKIMQHIHRVEKLLEKRGHLWTQLLEDRILQELQGKKDKLHAAMAYVKKQQRTMSLP
jgi:hypothetical protein